MKHTFTRLTAAALTVFLLSGLAACGGTPSGSQSDTDADVSAEPERSFPDFGGRTFTVYANEHSARDQQRMMMGPEELTGEAVDDAVYERNRKVEENLNVKFDYFRSSANWDDITPELNKLIMAGDDTYDLYTGSQYGIVKLMTNNCFANLNTLEGFQFDKSWWNLTYMQELSLNYDVLFFLAGDYFSDIIRATRVLYFNKTMYENYYGSVETLYKDVLDGKWTMDKLSEISKETYKDLNNDGKVDRNDQLGYVTFGLMASVDPFAYSAELPFITRNKDNTVSFNLKSERYVTLAEKLVSYFYQQGSLVMNEKEQNKVFSDGKAMFLGYSMFGDAVQFRDMKDDYGFLPHPKLDETQKAYHSLIHDNAVIGAVPVTSHNTDMTGYILDYLCELSHDTVLPLWYESALKIKYTRDDISSQIIDLIHDTAYTNFIYALSPMLKDIGMIYRTLAQKNSTDYMSTLDSMLPAAEAALDELLKVYQENQK